MRKIFFLPAMLGMVIVSSCNSDQMTDPLSQEHSGLSPEKVEIVENPYAINEDVAKEKALLFIEDTRKSMLRSSEVPEIENVSVETINYNVTIIKESKDRKVEQTVPVYTVTYEDASGESTGFVMIAGDERISDDVLVFSNDKGATFDLEAGDDADFFKDMIAGFLYKGINNQEDASEDENNVSARTSEWYSVDYGVGRMCSLTPTSINFAQTGTSFNKYTPLVNGRRTLAGSAAVAMCEIMAYHNWPLKGAYKRYTSTTSGLETFYPDYVLTEAERAGIISSNMAYCEAFYPKASEYVANMMAEIGYKLNSTYGLSTTIQYPNYVPQVFTQMGYTTGGISPYSFTAIQQDIEERGLPVFMYGYSTNAVQDNSCHSFVITGTYYKNYQTNGSKYIKIIHGNGGFYTDPNTGYGQTWFNIDMFNNPGYFDPNDVPYPYIYNCKIITNIKKNPTNEGSTNPNWKAY